MVQRYAHLSAEHMLEAAKRIEGAISGTPVQRGGLKLVVSR